LVDRGDYVIQATKLGSGRPIIALAGGPGFSGQAVWAVGFGMRRSCVTYLFDQLGTGGSQMKSGRSLEGAIDLMKSVEDLEALRKQVGHKRWAVFGQSWGAILALVYAAKYPSSVDQLILASIPGIGHDGTILSTNLADRLPKSVIDQISELATDESLTPVQLAERQVLTVTPYYFYNPEWGLSLAKDAPEDLFDGRVFLALRRHIGSSAEYIKLLETVRTFMGKVTLIQGHQDPCGAAMPYRLKERFLPRAAVHMLDRCGHFPWIERSNSFFTIMHEVMGLPAPEYLDHELTDADHPTVVEERTAREQAGWPFGTAKPAERMVQ